MMHPCRQCDGHIEERVSTQQLGLTVSGVFRVRPAPISRSYHLRKREGDVDHAHMFRLEEVSIIAPPGHTISTREFKLLRLTLLEYERAHDPIKWDAFGRSDLTLGKQVS